MKKMNNLIQRKGPIVLVALCVGLMIGRFISPSQINERQHDDKAGNEPAVQQIWSCAMHIQIQQPDPGQCPICGMELIPLETGSDESGGAHVLQLSEGALRIAEVQTTILEKGKGERIIALQGKIRKDERRVSVQTSHIEGRIEKLFVNFTGQQISKGQRIASVYSPQLVTAQEELFEAKKYATQNPALLKAVRNKLKRWKLSEQQIAAIESQDSVQTKVDIKWSKIDFGVSEPIDGCF